MVGAAQSKGECQTLLVFAQLAAAVDVKQSNLFQAGACSLANNVFQLQHVQCFITNQSQVASDGRILGQDTQTVTGFVRGMEKYLCFRPGRDFHTFSYTLETSLFHGVSAEKNFRFDGFQVKPLYGTEEEEKPRKGIYPVQLHVTEEYVGTREVEVSCAYILLDKENTVHGICTPPPRRLTEPVPAHTFPAAEFSYLSKGEIPLDEELPKEGVKGICVYTVTPV